jgi:hypothetical protein
MEITNVLVAFAGGILGAALGGLWAFVIIGFLILIAVGAQATGGDLLSIPLGTAFGPHVGGFASGVAASAYAAKKGLLESGKDIASPLMGLGSPDVLLVGGVFGLIGYTINYCFTLVSVPWTDTIALTVVVSAMIVRIAWGNDGLLGKVDEGAKRFAPADGTQWVPWQSGFAQRVTIGLGAGTLSAYIALLLGVENGGVVLGFAISAVSLALLILGMKVPVTHHITLVAAVVAVSSGSVIWGTIFGIGSAVFAETFANTFLVHGDTHIDPPATAIATMTSLSLLCGNLGLFELPMPF